MTYRLTVLTNTSERHVEEFDTCDELMRFLIGPTPWTGAPDGIAIRHLAEFEQTTWSKVAEGDEVLAPDGTMWAVESVKTVNSMWSYAIVNVHDGREVVTTPRPDVAVQRRPGAVGRFVQMMAEGGIATTFIR